MRVNFIKYLRGNAIFARAILELKGSIHYIRKNKFIEIISLKKQLNITTLMLKGTFPWQCSVPKTENLFGRQ